MATEAGTKLMRWRQVLVLACVLALSACATGNKQMTALERAQYDWSAAIRWEDFEGAWNLVAPDYREANPMSQVEFERYKQLEVSTYHDLGSQVSADGLSVRREIQIGVINRHTMTERSIRYTEAWRFDPEQQAWWVTSGLPDFWAGM